jgi:2-C-methyl-D-erythritol 4-phosphate cytidylyltransferase
MSTDDPTPALGTIVDEARGSLPYLLIHGESLVACAAWALGDAMVTTVDLGTRWAGVVDSGEPFVLHDPLCPMTPASFIADCVTRAVTTDTVVVGVDDAGAVLSPVVLPASVVAELAALPSTDFDVLVARLADRFTVERVLAPASAARVASADDVAELELRTTPDPGSGVAPA